MIMKMTKALTMTWIPPTDPECAIRAHHERAIQAIYTELDGKTNSDNNVRIDDHTIQRQWRDQAAVDEFIEFMYNLSVKYGGTVVVGKTINL
jgi:hypothetical protein